MSEKRRSERMELPCACRVTNAEDVFGTRRGIALALGAIVRGRAREGGLAGVLRNISAGGALIELSRSDFAGGKGFYMVAADKPLMVELKTPRDGEHITNIALRPSRIKVSDDKIFIGGVFETASKTLIPVDRRRAEGGGLVITWPSI